MNRDMATDTAPTINSTPMYQSDEEMMYRQKYLRQEGESKEQREKRIANVQALLKESRDAQIGVKNKKVLKEFSKGRGGV